MILALHHQFVKLREIYYLVIYSNSLKRCANCLKNELNVHLIHSRAGIICLPKCFCKGKSICKITKREYFGKSASSDPIKYITLFVLFYVLLSCFFFIFFMENANVRIHKLQFQNILQPLFGIKNYINIYQAMSDISPNLR